jgi:hypothetical protein
MRVAPVREINAYEILAENYLGPRHRWDNIKKDMREVE